MSDSAREELRIGTSGWSYKDWVGPFYADGTSQGEFLARYAERFSVVEVDSTFYRVPSVRMVEGWAARTPDDFRFALKMPGAVTHGAEGQRPNVDKVLVDEESTLDAFLEALEPLGDKAGVLVFQFPYFRVKEMARDDFVSRLSSTLESLPESKRFAVEIRNKGWIDAEYLALLRKHRVAAVMIDHPYMPPPREQLARGMVTTDFAYVRLLGDRYGIEKITKKWDRIVVEKDRRLAQWSEVLVEIIARHGVAAAWAFANNHFAGHGPDTSRQLLRATLDRLDAPGA